MDGAGERSTAASRLPLVTVVIPIFNCEKYIGEAIESVLAQTYRPIEVIVVDDGSSDGTAAAARRFSDVLYCAQPHAGPGAARNRGVDLARGDLLAFLDADDVWMPEKLERQIAAFGADPALDMVLGRVEQFHSPDLDDQTRSRLAGAGTVLAGYAAGALLIKRASFLRVGTFTTAERVGEFIDWYARAMEHGLKSLVLPDIVLRRRIHRTNTVIREHDAKGDYVKILKASLDRRRKKEAARASAAVTTGNPLVSVIMAVKNGARFLASAIDSVLAQEYRPLEIVVVDGGSEDDSASIARSYPGVEVLPQTGAGIADAYNTGIDAANGDILAFLSCDDVWTPGKLSTQVGYLLAHSEVQYVTARARFFLEPGSAIPPGFRPNLLEGDHTAHIMETLVARRSAFRIVGRFDPTLSTAEDVDWFSRARDRGVPTAAIHAVLLHKRVHGNNLSLNDAAGTRDLLLAVKRSVDRKRRG